MLLGLKDVGLVLSVGEVCCVLLLFVGVLCDNFFDVLVYGGEELDWLVLVLVVVRCVGLDECIDF